ncbi:ABC transporter permease [Salsuginibacillus kocurii]|uniref:ABC transporter permease n=1 Tax=Salsuginibacillus kocurii TaxID=427078 RepID=UPI0003765672|nr:ABC transporter permease [Salsuginibacillus kocurii]
MSFSINRVYAIFQKDVKELAKNLMVLSTIIMPLFFALLFGREDPVVLEIHYLIINLTLVSVAAFVQCAIIAEEKEKNTLRGLMMSPASVVEILTGKSLVSIILTGVTFWVCINITGYQPENWGVISTALIISLIFYLALGTLLGLVTRTLMEASVVIVPFILVFGMGVLFTELMGDLALLEILEYLPNIQLEQLAATVENGGGFAEVGSELAIISGWTLITLVAVQVVYQKRKVDGM